jgi:hypothetical protein
MNTQLEAAIQQYGHTNLNPVLKHIKTFDDLLVFGQAFLSNKLYRSVSYFGEFGKCEDTNGHQKERERLLQIHSFQNRCYTVSGQINDENQRSYISFFCESATAKKLLPQLQARNDIYFMMLCPEGKKYFNFSSNSINLTRIPIVNNETNEAYMYPTNMWADLTHECMCNAESTHAASFNNEGDDEDEWEIQNHPNFDKIFDQLVFVEFCVKEYNYYIETAGILLEMLSS